MKSFGIILAFFVSFTSLFAQNIETHAAKVMGSYDFSGQEITIIYDEVSQCERKTNPHSKDLFTPDETVEIRLTEGNETAEVIKASLTEQVFVNQDCETSARNGSDEVIVNCVGSCNCSLQGVLSGSESYVTCSCDDCTMEIEFSSTSLSGETTTYILNDQVSMSIPYLEDFLNFAEALSEYTLNTIEIYRNDGEAAVEFIYEVNGVENTTMFAKAAGKKYQITCEGTCGCREVYSFETNSASCSCEDCVMTVEEVSSQ